MTETHGCEQLATFVMQQRPAGDGTCDLGIASLTPYRRTIMPLMWLKTAAVRKVFLICRQLLVAYPGGAFIVVLPRSPLCSGTTFNH